MSRSIAKPATVEPLTGTAGLSDVLSGKTFYNDDAATKRTGSMTSKVGSATVITPSGSEQVIPQGYYGGAAGDGKVSPMAPNYTSGQFGQDNYGTDAVWTKTLTTNFKPAWIVVINEVSFTAPRHAAYAVEVCLKSPAASDPDHYARASGSAPYCEITEITSTTFTVTVHNNGNSSGYTWKWFALGYQ